LRRTLQETPGVIQRVLGLLRVGNDFSLLTSASSLSRMAKLQAPSSPCGGWKVVM
jgi:hypothetical protein